LCGLDGRRSIIRGMEDVLAVALAFALWAGMWGLIAALNRI
jgi:hypothetical protein